jgi:hypothetical protein
MITLYEYQRSAVEKAKGILQRNGVVYLAMDMRTGKTPTSLSIAKELGCNDIFVIYPNKNVEAAFIRTAAEIGINITTSSNHPDTIAKFIGNKYDCIIVDEAHNFKAYPKPSGRAKQLRELVWQSGNPYIILLSGTPYPEGYSDLYHQFWSVRKETHKNFYAFASEYVNIKEKRVAGGNIIKDYSDCSSKYYDALREYFIVVGREEAGIFTEKRLIIEEVEMPVSCMLAKKLPDGILEYNGKLIVVDNIAKEMQILRQLCGGVLYDNEGNYHLIDTGKCKRLKEVISRYKKTLVFYYYQAERELLLRELHDVFTEDIEQAKNSDKHLLLQMVSGREGITFAEADAIIYYSLDFSAVTYLQSQERATIRGKDKVDVIYLFSRVGFDGLVYKALQGKKRYTVQLYEKDRHLLHPVF